MIAKTFFNRSPLPPNHLTALPLGAVRPRGWLEAQLRLLADGVFGHLFEAWEPVGEDCAWLGGQGDSSDLAPLYLNGLQTLGWLLGDETLKAAAQRYLDAALASQREDGFFGPEGADDYSRGLMLQAFCEAFGAQGDRRYLQFIDRYLRWQLKALSREPLRGVSAARSGVLMRTAMWLYNITEQKYLLRLCGLLREQGLDWTNFFYVFPAMFPARRQHPWDELNRRLCAEEPPASGGMGFYEQTWRQIRGADVAWGLCQPGLVNLFKSGFKEVGAFRTGWQKLTRYHGVANGMFTCDEALDGNSPSQGVDLAAACGVIGSIATLLAVGGEFGDDLPDIMEKIALNVLPAAFNADMSARAMLQRPNQASISPDAQGFYNLSGAAALFDSWEGSRESLACCGNGFGDYTRSLWMATADEGLEMINCAPCRVLFRAGGETVRITVESGYPFEGRVRLRVETRNPVEFPLYLRVPSWAPSAVLRLPDGEILKVQGGQTPCVRRVYQGSETVEMEFPMEARLRRLPNHASSVEIGPLVMCLRGEPVFQERGIETANALNYALADEQLKTQWDSQQIGPFKSGDPVRVMARLAPAPKWRVQAASLPIDPETGPAEVMELTPYGSSMLRVSQFPTGRRQIGEA